MTRRLVIFAAVLLVAASTRSAEALPEASVVLKRLQSRLEQQLSSTNKFTYTRTNTVDELDSGGKLKKRSLKIYRVTQAQGLPRARLVCVDGRWLSESEQRTRTADELRLQRTIAEDKNPDQKKPKAWLTDELLERFQFTVAARTNIQGRSALILTFQPVPDAPVRQMSDRIVNKIRGELWIDEAEDEIVYLQIGTGEAVKFWGGILGQLDRFNWTLHRLRSPFGAWYNSTSMGSIQIRKLFATTQYNLTEVSHNFAPTAEDP